jgi:hypothetical protein
MTTRVAPLCVRAAHRCAIAVAVAACIGAGCGSGDGSHGSSSAATSADAAGEFYAFAADFAHYRTWSSLVVVDDAGTGDPAHLDTVLVEYINQPAPPVGEPFPQGTILVKEGTSGDPNTRQAFAMVKRGGAYNADGAAGWEWFEVQNDDDAGDVAIVWRGTAPPSGQTYSGNVNGDCNGCHVKAPHDAVFAQ